MRKFWFAIFFANLALILWFWWGGSHSLLALRSFSGAAIAFGRLFGLLGEYFLLAQLVMIGRIKPVEQTFGHDKMNKLHRWVGYGLALFLPLHPILLVIGYASVQNVSPWTQFVDFLFNFEDVALAFVGLVIIVGVVCLSLPAVRRKFHYEHWHLMHLLMYAGVGFAFVHQTSSTDALASAGFLTYWYVLNFVVFGVVLAYRFLYPFYLWYKHRFVVDRVVQEAPGIWSVYIAGRGIEKFKYKACQFANLLFLARKAIVDPHPFSFSQVAGGDSVRFTIKGSGDFTSTLPDIVKPGTRVLLDGPLGIFTKRAGQRDKYLLIAGGIGITPIRSLAEELSQSGNDTVLFYSARSEEDQVLSGELKKLKVSLKLETGRVTIDIIKQAAPDFLEREIFICGPGPMITALRDGFVALGVPIKHIHYELFSL